jgi:hypothetical protein
MSYKERPPNDFFGYCSLLVNTLLIGIGQLPVLRNRFFFPSLAVIVLGSGVTLVVTHPMFNEYVTAPVVVRDTSPSAEQAVGMAIARKHCIGTPERLKIAPDNHAFTYSCSSGSGLVETPIVLEPELPNTENAKNLKPF